MFRRGLKLAAKALLVFVLLLVLYFGAAVVGALWPRNANFISAAQGVPIWVLAGPIHTDVIVPVKNEVFDWSTLVDAKDVKAPDPSLDHLAIGWGDRKFYLETKTWQDVKVRNVLSAFCGLDATAMHVQWCSGNPQLSARCRYLVLTAEQYKALCDFMLASFHRDGSSRAVRIDAPGYVDTDAFYEAEGRYSALRTCNTWTGNALAAGGARVGRWTPTTWGVMWQLPAPP